MEKGKRYITLQLKRMMRFLVTVFISSTVLVLCLVFFASAVLKKDVDSEKKMKVQVGLVGDTSNTYLEFGLFALKHLDSSRFAIEIVEMSEEEAIELMEAGTLSAYIIIPENFAENLERGINIPVSYVTCNGAVGITSIMMKEIAEEISDFITGAENMMFAVQEFGWEYGYREAYQDTMVEKMFFQVVETLINRTELFEVTATGVSEGLSLMEYYVCALSILFLLLLGISCCHIYVKRDMVMTRLLYSRGFGLWKQVGGEYVTYFLLALFSFFVAGGYIFIIMQLFQEQLDSLGINIGENLMLLVTAMIPVILLISSVQFCLFETVSNVVSGILIQIIFALGMGYISGCFYPVSFLPDSLQVLSEHLPVGVALQYVKKCLLQQSAVKEIILMAGYFALAMGITVWLRKEKVEKRS